MPLYNAFRNLPWLQVLFPESQWLVQSLALYMYSWGYFFPLCIIVQLSVLKFICHFFDLLVYCIYSDPRQGFFPQVNIRGKVPHLRFQYKQEGWGWLWLRVGVDITASVLPLPTSACLLLIALTLALAGASLWPRARSTKHMLPLASAQAHRSCVGSCQGQGKNQRAQAWGGKSGRWRGGRQKGVLAPWRVADTGVQAAGGDRWQGAGVRPLDSRATCPHALVSLDPPLQ